MSSIASTMLQKSGPKAGPEQPAQHAFAQGTRSLLDEARSLVENSAQQGQELNPSIYRMLGMEPTYEDNSEQLKQSQAEFDASQKQLDAAQTTLAQLRGVPPGKRSPDQKRQFKQLQKQIPTLQKSLETTRDVHGRLATSPKTITGFTKMDPNSIPADSPFSAQNPLHQAQATEQDRLNQYLSGTGAVDPTLTHQYDAAEATLKQNLASKYGPDFANSTVGQMALQNFTRQKNEAYATWNQQMVERYNQMAFSGAQNLQGLTAGQIALLREPAQDTANAGANLSNLSGARLSQQGANLAERGAQQGVITNTTSPAGLIGSAASGLGSLLTTPYQTTDAQGRPVNTTLAGQGLGKLVGGATATPQTSAITQTAKDALAVDAGTAAASTAGSVAANDALWAAA